WRPASRDPWWSWATSTPAPGRPRSNSSPPAPAGWWTPIRSRERAPGSPSPPASPRPASTTSLSPRILRVWSCGPVPGPPSPPTTCPSSWTWPGPKPPDFSLYGAPPAAARRAMVAGTPAMPHPSGDTSRTMTRTSSGATASRRVTTSVSRAMSSAFCSLVLPCIMWTRTITMPRPSLFLTLALTLGPLLVHHFLDDQRTQVGRRQPAEKIRQAHHGRQLFPRRAGAPGGDAVQPGRVGQGHQQHAKEHELCRLYVKARGVHEPAADLLLHQQRLGIHLRQHLQPGAGPGRHKPDEFLVPGPQGRQIHPLLHSPVTPFRPQAMFTGPSSAATGRAGERPSRGAPSRRGAAGRASRPERHPPGQCPARCS